MSWYSEQVSEIYREFNHKENFEAINDAFDTAQADIFDLQENSGVFDGWTDDEKYVEWWEDGVTYPRTERDTDQIEDYAEEYVIKRVREILDSNIVISMMTPDGLKMVSVRDKHKVESIADYDEVLDRYDVTDTEEYRNINWRGLQDG